MTDSTSIIAQIPTSFYVIVGGLMLANLGTVVTVLYGIGKMIWWMSKLDARVEHVEKVHLRDINAAHQAIKEMRKQIQPNQ